MPLIGPGGPIGVLSVLRTNGAQPQPDQVELLTLYAGYATSAIERDRLLGEATARNRVLETIRDMLEALGRPPSRDQPFVAAATALCQGLRAQEVAMAQTRSSSPGRLDPETETPANAAFPPGSRHDPRYGAEVEWRVCVDGDGNVLGEPGSEVERLVQSVLDAGGSSDSGQPVRSRGPGVWTHAAIAFTLPGSSAVLVASWRGAETPGSVALLRDAARSLRLALEREQAEHALREAEALRRSREMQRMFLSRLGHELRTPLTAIGGYASSLLQADVEWDHSTSQRFLGRIASESARLGRLVDDLLDFSAIEAGILRLQPDWCDLELIVDAAIACLPGAGAQVEVRCDPPVPPIWADHDRLEQVFVNLLGNARRHNPPGTRVQVLVRLKNESVRGEEPDPSVPERKANAMVVIDVVDDGPGFGAFGTSRGGVKGSGSTAHRPPMTDAPEQGSGAGLGLSISEGIVAAHGGTLERVAVAGGTCLRIRLPLEKPD